MSTMADNDQLDAIVALAQGGSRAAIRDLILQVQGELRNFVAARAPSLDLVDEIVQAALVLVIEKIRTYERRATFMPWLKGIALNLLRTEVRRLQRQVDLSPDRLDAAVLAHAEVRLEEAEDDPRVGHLRDCLAALPERNRLMLVRHYHADGTLRQLAQQFKQNERALAMTLHRIRALIRQCLAAKGVEA
jgi:RNA polymerase sigma-70 factor (ECF subfamily)